MGRFIIRVSAVGGLLLAFGLAALLIRQGVPTGVAVTSAMLLVGLVFFLCGRLLANLYPDSSTSSVMAVVGVALLFLTTLCGLVLGKEYWPQANAFLLFSGSVVVVVTLSLSGQWLINRLAPART